MIVQTAWILAAAAVLPAASAPQQEKPAAFPKPSPSSAEEPLARELSLARAGEFLDGASVNWTREEKCGACHTNYPYLMARPLLGKDDPGPAEVRRFFEGRVAHWDTARPRWDTEVVATAATLAIHDRLTTGKLHPLTRQALDRMWTLQRKNGAWNWLKCNWPPHEHDDYFGAAFAAVGVGLAPDDYAKSEDAKDGLEKLRGYFRQEPAPNLHHKAWLLWASCHIEGLMGREERDAAVQGLLARQRDDGGWSLGSLGDWKGKDGRRSDPNAPGDGYATGLAVYVLRQAGVSAREEPVRKGADWLRRNQRESGRWFTRSLNSDKAHLITHAGTSFAVMALKACD